MTSPDTQVRNKLVSGARWVLILNVATLPLALLTSMALGHVSPETLGYYGAIQLFAATFQVFFVFGGPQVFARLAPAVDERDRTPFLWSYTGLVLGFFALTITVVLWLAPAWIDRALERVGGPTTGLAVGVALAVLILAFTGHFLFAVLRGDLAAISQRSVLVGFFIAAILGVGPFREVLERQPAEYLWWAALIIFGLAAGLGIVQSTRVDEFRKHPVARWFLPPGFWSIALYSHAVTIIEFTYHALAPMVVLVWLDVTSLGYFHAALRYQVIVRMVPLLLSAVLTPGLSRMDAAGRRDDIRRHANFAIGSSLLLITPPVLALTAFAGPAMAVFGAGFDAHRDLLRILAVGFIAGPLIHLGTGILVAIGAFRSYLSASAVFVVSALALTLVLVPALGLTGAALAATAGAWVQQGAIVWLLRRNLGLSLPSRLWAACGWTAAAAGFAVVVDPGPLGSLALLATATLGFGATGGVTPKEIGRLARLTLKRGT